MSSGSKTGSEMRQALGQCRSALLGIGFFSALVNILYLVGPLFMLQVYDRVLSSGSVPTLVALATIVIALYVCQGILDVIRTRLLVRVGSALDHGLGSRIYQVVVRAPLVAPTRGDGLQAVRDMDQIRSFFAGAGPLAFFDMPWLPIYVAVCFLLHVWIGILALAGAIMLIAIAITTEILSRKPTREATTAIGERNGLAEAGRRNAEVLRAMGMEARTARRWSTRSREHTMAVQRSGDISGGLSALSKVLRFILQSALLATGAYLALQQEVTAGVIIAGSIVASRALAPVELAVGNWRGFIAARQSWARLSDLLAGFPVNRDPLPLPRPHRELNVAGVTITPPGQQRIVVEGVSFELKAGQALGVIGPSASGKSSLARALVGLWRPAQGKIRLDGAALDQWSPEALGEHIGYVPQEIELFDGTVTDNISRFHEDPDPTSVIAAAQEAGVHELILGLPEGYSTKIGSNGELLSAGQRQRLALARALYGNPFLVVMDEPNSNLDANGEAALTQAITRVRSRGGIAIIVAHRPSALAAVDTVLMINNGRIQAFGPRDEVLKQVLQTAPGVVPLVSEAQR